MLDPQSQLVLLAIFAVIGIIVAVADVVIFVRWLLYLWARQDVEERRAIAAASEETPLYPTQAASALAAENELADFSPVAVTEPIKSEPVPQSLSLETPASPFARSWSLVDPFIAIQVVLGVSFTVIAVVLATFMIKSGQMSSDDAMFGGPSIIIQSLGGFLMNALFVGMTAFYLHRYRSSLAKIGLGRPTVRQLAIGLGLGFVLFGIASVGEWAIGNALPLLLPKAVVEGLAKFTGGVTAGGIFAKIPSPQLKIVFALAGIIAAPIGEEVYFRGLLYNSLKRRFRVSAAIAISGFLFAVLHLGPLAILIIFPMGMLLAYVYEKTGSLWVTIGIHVTNNALSFAMLMFWPHLGEPPEPARPAAPPSKPGYERFLPPAARPVKVAPLHE